MDRRDRHTMHRREFSRMMLGAAGASLVSPLTFSVQLRDDLRVDGGRLNENLKRLAAFGENDQGGVTRVAYSEADVQGREFVMDLMRAAGLQVHIDAAGNIIGRCTGAKADLPPIMTGSHTDTVPSGGNYDGPAGVLSAIEAAQTLADTGTEMQHPLEVVVFANEEGGKTGSRALSGELTERDLDFVTHSGKTNREGIEIIGGDPGRALEIEHEEGDVAAFLELHIEQGAVLEQEDCTIGVVEGIVGIKRWMVTVEGFANHAGTTPMDARQDALLSAAAFVEAVNRVVTSEPGRQVGTVGQIDVSPGAPNVIPGEVEVSLEIRDLDMSKIDRLYQRIEAEARRIGQERETPFSFDHVYTTQSAPTEKKIQQLVIDAAEEIGLKYLSMPSGAGHDAQSIAHFASIGMIFIPSVGGISHSPEEYSRPEDVEAGANVLLHTLLKLDQQVVME